MEWLMIKQHLLALHTILHKGNTEGIGMCMLQLCVFTFISLYNVYESILFHIVRFELVLM